MRLAFFGDIVGKPGRVAMSEHLPALRRDLDLDFVVVNAENAAGGFGLTEKIANVLFDAGADCLTLGDHAWDQREMLTYIEREPRIIRPLNYPAEANAPGRGSNLFTLQDGRRVGVIQLQGNVFMRQVLDNAFAAADTALDAMPLGAVADAIIIDFHCEATSEKMAMGHYCDGRASLVVGTHTHIPTADQTVLPGGTGYQTDAGMCGDYDSVIGMQKDLSIARFLTQMPGKRYEPANEEATLCGIFVETEPATGLATNIEPIRVGGRLSQTG
ncbi:MAG: TIGR00282 family metallophosphoesterase [Pseudomonadota bacterium]